MHRLHCYQAQYTRRAHYNATVRYARMPSTHSETLSIQPQNNSSFQMPRILRENVDNNGALQRGRKRVVAARQTARVHFASRSRHLVHAHALLNSKAARFCHIPSRSRKSPVREPDGCVRSFPMQCLHTNQRLTGPESMAGLRSIVVPDRNIESFKSYQGI
jgi:hypothetical protein